MSDRFQSIRDALVMGPTPGPRKAVEQSVIGPHDLRILSANVTWSVGVNGSHSVPIEEAIANATLAAACDPDTIRELLAERDALRDALETMVEMVEMNGFVWDYAMDAARAALSKENSND